MRRAQKVLLAAFVLSLLVHAIVALLLHPPRASFENQAEVVGIIHRSVMVAARNPTPPPPRPARTIAPRTVASARPHARTGRTAQASAGGSGRASPPPTPPPATPPAIAAGGACDSPNASAAVIATPAPPDIPTAVRAQDTNGIAAIRVDLDASGQVLGASVAQSTGNSSLDLVAVGMARDARYSAPLRACKPVAGSYTFSVKFVAW